MKRYCRILNKHTNKIYQGQIDSELEGKFFYPLVDISSKDSTKQYIWKNNKVVENLPSLEELKVLKLAENEEAYQVVKYGYKEINGLKVNIDPDSKTNLTGRAIKIFRRQLLGLPPQPVVWSDEDNKEITITEEDFLVLGEIVADTIETMELARSAYITAIKDSTTKAELDAINIVYNI